ncbi:peptidase M23 [Plantactinospora sp. WMMB782]|uniref:peptidase M23 n=1 Tax=Plantactinospora sp. WMMB782 TaxID=3404121 RepID=UPI003B9517A0
MPDDDRSESGHPAVPSTVRSDDVPSSDPGSGALPPQPPRGLRATGAATGLRSLLLLLLLPLSRHLRLLGPARIAVAAGVLCCLGALAVVQAVSPADPAEPGTASSEDQVALSRPDDGTRAQPGADRSADRSSRSGNHDRSDAAKPAGPDPDTASPLDDAKPVAGLSEVQMDNARAIVRTGRDMGISRRGLIIGVATAMQESTLLNRASEVLPESKRYRHQGTGWDHDSVGLFQQRTSSGWGPVNRLMDPAYASARFFEALRQVPGWERMRLTEAAQAVQYSAYPEHYAKHEGQATRVVDALVPSWR